MDLLIQGALHSKSRPIKNMGVNHRRGDIGMAEQFLHRADVVIAFKKVRGKGMPEDMTAHLLSQSRLYCSIFDRLLEKAFVKMVASYFFASRIYRELFRGKHILPYPFFCGIG